VHVTFHIERGADLRGEDAERQAAVLGRIRQHISPRPSEQQPTFDQPSESADSRQLSPRYESVREPRSGLQGSLGGSNFIKVASSCGLGRDGCLAATTESPPTFLSVTAVLHYEPFLIHEDEVATASKEEAIERYCRSRRRTTGWVIAFRERRGGHDQPDGSDR
jgi:hypothetical protein